jgi:hypothetical protein
VILKNVFDEKFSRENIGLFKHKLLLFRQRKKHHNTNAIFSTENFQKSQKNLHRNLGPILRLRFTTPPLQIFTTPPLQIFTTPQVA